MHHHVTKPLSSRFLFNKHCIDQKARLPLRLYIPARLLYHMRNFSARHAHNGIASRRERRDVDLSMVDMLRYANRLHFKLKYAVTLIDGCCE